MMKKLILVFAALMMLMAGCGTSETKKVSDQPKTEENKKEQVTVQITKDNGKEKVAEKKVAITEETTIMDVMKDNFKIETQFDDSFISSIEGIAGSEQDKTSWFFSVNGEEAMKGAKEITLKPGDTVEFDFHKYE
jgi:ABC-type enterochelin transport system substrate-binding protein